MPQLERERISADQLWDRFGRVEHASLELKRALGKGRSAQESFVALANTDGGDVLIGITDEREVIGCVGDTQAVLDELHDVLHEIAWSVEPTVSVLDVDRRTVIRVVVPPQRRGVASTSDGRVLRRMGSRSRVLTGEQLVHFVSARATGSALDRTVPEVEIDLDVQLIEKYLEARGTPRRVPTQEAALEALESLGLCDGGRLRLAAIVLFGTRPEAALPGARVTFVRVPGVNPQVRYERRRELTGPLPELIREAWTLVFQEMRREAVVHGLFRQELPEYPPAAVREAIVNAMVHRDYGLAGAEVFIRMFDDRIEIQSPGPLPAGITEENIRNEQFSRNPLLTDALLHLGLMERLGEGMDLIYREMETYLLNPPILRNTEQSFTVTLRNQSLLSLDDKVWLLALEHLTNSTMSVAHRLALVRARNEGAVTNRALRDASHLPREESRRVLQELKDWGLLRVRGQRGGTEYVLAGTAAESAALKIASREAQLTALMEHARVNEKITNRDARVVLGEDDPALARALLAELNAAGKLSRVGRAKGTYYVPTRLEHKTTH